MSIIAISGKINNGKDAVGNIVNYHIVKKYWKAIDWDFYNQEGDDKVIEQTLLKGEHPVKLRYDVGLYKTKKFADKLKDTICLWIGCTREQLEDRKFKEAPLPEAWWKYTDGVTSVDYLTGDTSILDGYNIVVQKTTPRILLQQLGTECGRDIIHNNIWVNATMSEYKDTENWMITDCRFPNEAEAVHTEGGITIRVNRPIQERFPELWEEYIGNSEALKKYGDEEDFLVWLKTHDEDMWKKLTHASEVSLDSYGDFTYTIDNNGTFEDLIEKVREILVQETIL